MSDLNLESGVPAQEPLFSVDKGIPPAKLNLLKKRVIQPTAADGEVGDMTRMGGNCRDPKGPPTVGTHRSVVIAIVKSASYLTTLSQAFAREMLAKLSLFFPGWRTSDVLRRQLRSGIIYPGNAIKWFSAAGQFHGCQLNQEPKEALFHRMMPEQKEKPK